MTRVVPCLPLVLLLLGLGCAGYLRVSSEPSGARILIDGQDTGDVTPAALRLRDVPLGTNEISVQTAAGELSQAQLAKVTPSVGIIFWSLVIPPLGLVNLFRGFSKVYPKTLHFRVRPPGPAPQSAPVAAAPAPSAQSGFETFTGQRQQIERRGTKCATLPVRAIDVPEQITFIADDILLTELQHAGFEAIGPDDINAMVGFEEMKDKLDCSDASCMAEIGNALGVTYLAAGNIATLEGGLVLTLKLLDVDQAIVLARVSKMSDGGSKTMPRLIAEAVQEMVVRSGL